MMTWIGIGFSIASACFLLLSVALVEAQQVQKMEVGQPKPGSYDNDAETRPVYDVVVLLKKEEAV